MITRYTINQLFSDFFTRANFSGLYEKAVYNPTLDWESARKEIVKNDVAFNEANALNNWIILIWSRSGLRRTNELNKRNFRVRGIVENEFSSKLNFALAETTISVKAFSSSVSLLENFEERLFFIDDDVKVEFEIPEIGDLTAKYFLKFSGDLDYLSGNIHSSSFELTTQLPVIDIAGLDPVITEIIESYLLTINLV